MVVETQIGRGAEESQSLGGGTKEKVIEHAQGDHGAKARVHSKRLTRP